MPQPDPSIQIRPAVVNDAAVMLDLFAALDSETPFMFIEPGERVTSLEQQKARISGTLGSDSSLIIVAEDSASQLLAGFVGGYSNPGARNRHIISLVVGLRLAYTARGIGPRLLAAHQAWAEANAKHKIELTVMENNPVAIRLYRSQGFVEEGLKLDAVRLGDIFVNEIIMGKIL